MNSSAQHIYERRLIYDVIARCSLHLIVIEIYQAGIKKKVNGMPTTIVNVSILKKMEDM